MRLSGITTESITDGPGVRYVVYTQGCKHGCKNCHNPDTWDLDGGEEFTVREIINKVKRIRKKYKGITFSGGEPFLQADELVQVAIAAKQKGWDVVTFTGYLYEDLIKNVDDGVRALLGITDILVDGPFVDELRDTTLPFRGSSNQRIIDLAATREIGKMVLYN